MASSNTSTGTLLQADAKPPKSKSAQYYSIHPLWQNVDPIPQADQSGALAAIAYSPRYAEAMSYLRALMAENEVSERALALTEDLISMNPAHYTVWIYRMRILKGLWEASKAQGFSSAKVVEVEDEDDTRSEQITDPDQALWDNIDEEIKWLDEVSFRNLKNYQIWHHRHALADLLPPDPSSATDSSGTTQPADQKAYQKLSAFIVSEQRFLAQILSLDTKNYHVWSYRQWLCSRFPSFLLPSTTQFKQATSIAPSYRSHPEVAAMDVMIDDDVRNNSAWSHRYYLLFGHRELTYAQSQEPPLILKQVNDAKLLHKAGLVDTDLVQAEIEYTKQAIRKAPQNGSSWNYLSGVLKHGDVEDVILKEFCEEFLGPEGDLWTDQWVVVDGEKNEIGVRSSRAIEWLSDIYAKDSAEAGRERARQCLKALSEKWDIIRRGYWGWKLDQMEEYWVKDSTAKVP